MIEINQFIAVIDLELHRTITPSVEGEPPGQYEAISSQLNESLFIVAGPGSGKTTVLTLRVLKIIFLDRVDPSTILVTTFTKKAAAELRSNILRWGIQLKNTFLSQELDSDDELWISSLDFNQIITGTLDSISEMMLREYRDPANPSPTVIEDFIARSIMLKTGLFEHNLLRNQNLIDYIYFLSDKDKPPNAAEITQILLEIKDRLYHDRVRFEEFSHDPSHPGIELACRAIRSYCEELDRLELYDYSKIENQFYEHLCEQRFVDLQGKLRFILVDEYQDTNLLQEKIYFKLAEIALSNEGSISVVGDDDQSIYHFRGASVDLFTSFPERMEDQLDIRPETMYLSKNYRSTQSIVNHVRNFVTIDPDYQEMRVEEKPPIEHARTGPQTDFPIIGIFRDDMETLGRDLALFLSDVTTNGGVRFTFNGENYRIALNENGGSLNDICILCHSPQERNTDNTRNKLPGELRNQLLALHNPIQVFNPRGQTLENILVVQQLCGLLIECIDPANLIDTRGAFPRLPQYVRTMIQSWRRQAQLLIARNNTRVGGITLHDFVTAWQTKIPIGEPGTEWRRDSSILELAYHLVGWIPEMQDDVEGIVYLEVILRTISQSSVFSRYKGRIIYDPVKPRIQTASIKDAVWSIFVPIASGIIEINEDLLETIPRNRIPIMSIHQAKGLQFPLVIVDVGSDFKKDYDKQRFMRFPTSGDKTCRIEDSLRTHCELEVPTRTGRDRCFDDLIRLYFVAYSRPQDLLILTGLNSVRNGYLRISNRKEPIGDIHHVATGWTRRRQWNWTRGLNNLHHVNWRN
jgi:DNA helicase II / ATP-dependent DNA helicase PcrA